MVIFVMSLESPELDLNDNKRYLSKTPPPLNMSKLFTLFMIFIMSKIIKNSSSQYTQKSKPRYLVLLVSQEV